MAEEQENMKQTRRELYSEAIGSYGYDKEKAGGRR